MPERSYSLLYTNYNCRHLVKITDIRKEGQIGINNSLLIILGRWRSSDHDHHNDLTPILKGAWLCYFILGILGTTSSPQRCMITTNNSRLSIHHSTVLSYRNNVIDWATGEKTTQHCIAFQKGKREANVHHGFSIRTAYQQSSRRVSFCEHCIMHRFGALELLLYWD